MFEEKNIKFNPFIEILKLLGLIDYIKLQEEVQKTLNDSE